MSCTETQRLNGERRTIYVVSITQKRSSALALGVTNCVPEVQGREADDRHTTTFRVFVGLGESVASEAGKSGDICRVEKSPFFSSFETSHAKNSVSSEQKYYDTREEGEYGVRTICQEPISRGRC